MSGFHMTHIFNQRNPAEMIAMELDVQVVNDNLVIRRYYRYNSQWQTPTVSEERIPIAQLEAEAFDWLTAVAIEWGGPPLLTPTQSRRLQAPPRTAADDFQDLTEELCTCHHSISFHAHHPDARSTYCFSCDCEEFIHET